MWLSRVVVEVWGLQCMTADVDCTPSTLIQSGRLNTLPLVSVLCNKCLLLSAGTTAHLWCRIQQQREQGAADRERKKSAASLSAVVLLCAAALSLRMLSSSNYTVGVVSMSSQQQQQQQGQETERGRGLAGARTTGVFRAVNFELFARPVSPPHLPRAAV